MKRIIGITSMLLMLSTSHAMAAATDSLIEGAKLCTRHLPRYEREYGIPTHLLSAIASTESGRYHEGLKIRIPWPWTINAEGKGYYFNSKDEAISAARKLRARGVKSMDVGCMQVNMMHHANAFSSLEQAFEPQNNIAYAASFLRNLYEEENHSWKQAASDYHSKTPSRGKQYVGTVYDSWYNIVNRLREAKLQAPSPDSFAKGETQVASAQQPSPMVKKFDPATKKLADLKPAAGLPKKSIGLPEQRGKQLAAYKATRMNSIKVTRQEDKRENGIIVVRPDVRIVDVPAPASIAANTTPDITMVAQAKSPEVVEAHVIRMNNTAVVYQEPKRNEPRFIFNN